MTEKKAFKDSKEWPLASFIFGILTIIWFFIIFFLLEYAPITWAWWKYDIVNATLVLGVFSFPILSIACGIVGWIVGFKSEKFIFIIFSLFGIIVGALGLFLAISLKGACC